ncbi:MAG: mannose-1-phosphate guanylyltransferase [Putridiphycobacter sp.]|nr:mannose-1-phosphate guanylyltransferase [Putridiphycobacter sp.]
MNKHNYAIIMAGGIGSRFWPMSKETFPKQFLDVLGVGESLIQMTYHRLLKVVPEGHIYVVTNTNYKGLVLDQLGINPEQVLTEPLRKNTAPCIAYAAHKIYNLDKQANLIVAPSDHLIMREDKFVNIIHTALEKSAKEDCLVTLGIKPSRPDTGYGYIQFKTKGDLMMGQVKKVKQFTEKPDKELAEIFVKSGGYYWNSGIFIWRAKTIIEAFKKFKPELNSLFESKGNDYNTSSEQTFVNKAFNACEDISIDFAILENAKNVYVVLANFGWSDLGTWGSLYAHLDKDVEGNAVRGKGVHLFDTENCIINLPDNKLALIQGLKDHIVVESDGVLMIVKQEDEQKIKGYLKEMKQKSPEHF